MRIVPRDGEETPLPAFNTREPVPLGPYMVKISVLAHFEFPTSMMVVYWRGRPGSQHWIEESRHNCRVAYFIEEPKVRDFITALAHDLEYKYWLNH